MYNPTDHERRQSLPAAFLGGAIVVVLFGILPLVNHIDAQRVESGGGAAPVWIGATRVTESAAALPKAMSKSNAIDLPALPLNLTQQQSGENAGRLTPLSIPGLEVFASGSGSGAGVGSPSDGKRGFAFEAADLDSAPLPFHRAMPMYPFNLRQAAIEGEVLVAFRVDPKGRVFDVSVINASHSEFGESVARAVLQWRFIPGTIRGEAVTFKVQLPVTFRLSDSPVSDQGIRLDLTNP